MKTHKQYLIDAKALIENPERWTIGVLARTKTGESTVPYSNGACKFCAQGALRAAINRYADLDDAEEIIFHDLDFKLDSFARELGFLHDIDANDNRKGGHDAVMKMFDLAIEAEG